MYKCLFSLCCLLWAALPADAQLVSFGVKAGVPFTDAYAASQVPDGGSSISQDRFIVGPTAEVHLPLHLSFDVDALFRRNGFGVQGDQLGGGFNISSLVDDWQFPFLGKYGGSFGPIHPFIDAGVVYRHVTLHNNAQTVAATNPNTAGFVVGAGVTLKILHLRLSPEIRYTHWGKSSFTIPFIDSTSNQADVLVGFTF